MDPIEKHTHVKEKRKRLKKEKEGVERGVGMAMVEEASLVKR